jgi:hypothetical protein
VPQRQLQLTRSGAPGGEPVLLEQHAQLRKELDASQRELRWDGSSGAMPRRARSACVSTVMNSPQRRPGVFPAGGHESFLVAADIASLGCGELPSGQGRSCHVAGIEASLDGPKPSILGQRIHSASQRPVPSSRRPGQSRPDLRNSSRTANRRRGATAHRRIAP